MPTTTAHGIVKMASDLEPADLYGTNTRLADSVETALAAADPTAWTAVTFENSWANLGGSYQTMQYRKVGDMVQLRGFITTGASATVAFTLPSGFRPPATVQADSVVSGGAVNGAVVVSSTGTVLVTRVASDIGICCEFSVTA